MKIRPETIKALADVYDALGHLRSASAEADGTASHTPPGSPEERYALQLSRLVRHLGDAIADTPTDLWLAMCNPQPETAAIKAA